MQWTFLAIILLLTDVSIAQQWGCGVKVKKNDIATLNQASVLYDKHQYKAAAKLLRPIASRNPKAAEPQFLLGMCAVKDGFNATGIRRYFSRCIELCPYYPDALAHFYHGIILYTDEHYDEASAALKNYFLIANNSDDPRYASVYEEASNYLYWSEFLAEATLNIAPFDPQIVRGVSSTNPEILPFLTHDGSSIFYLRQQPISNSRTFYARELDERRWYLCQSRLVDGSFSAGAPLPHPFNQGDAEGSVSITADGIELYYSIIRNESGYANSDIYRVVRKADGSWGNPENLGPTINGNRSWESQPSVSADGSTLYFASNRKGGHGGIDIWRCHRLKNGDWSRPENLGDNINTAGNEKCPFIHADGHTLYFVSDGWQGFGGYDIYFVNTNDPYGNRPTNLGLPINTESDETSLCVSADGTTAFFAGRTADSRSTDILSFDLYPAARPEPMTYCRFQTVDSSGSPLAASLQNSLGATYSGRGLIPAMLPARGLVVITSEGMLPFISHLTPRSNAATINVTLVPAQSGAVIPLSVKLLAGSRLDEASTSIVDAYAHWLLNNPSVSIRVECPRITDARTIHDRLRSHGISPSRLSYHGGTDIRQPQLRLP